LTFTGDVGWWPNDELSLTDRMYIPITALFVTLPPAAMTCINEQCILVATGRFAGVL